MKTTDYLIVEDSVEKCWSEPILCPPGQHDSLSSGGNHAVTLINI